MKTIRSFIACVLISASLLCGFAWPADAIAGQSDSETDYISHVYEIDDNTVVTVNIPMELEDLVSDADIQGILYDQELNSGDIVTIYEIGVVEPQASQLNSGGQSQPYGLGTFVTTYYSNYGAEYAAESYFITSVARGQAINLSTEFHVTAKIQLTSGQPYVQGQLGSSLSYTIKKSETFSGPPEGSQYNSREYRLRIYRRTKQWNQIEYTYGGAYCGERSGTMTEPTKFARYSIDSVIT